MKEYLICSYTHFLNGKHTNLGGPAQHLARYLGDRAYCIWQPIPIGKPNWVYAGLKLRDILVTLCLIRKARVFVGIESLNAIVGALFRKLGLFQRVVYWNLDFGPKRGLIWGFFDRLACRWADEIWVLKDRGLPKQKVVPIGAWLDDIDRSKERDPNGVVYIGLLEDMQGVGILLNELTCMDYHRHLTIIGTGKDEKKYRDFVNKNLLRRRVHFMGVLSDQEAQEIMTKMTYGWAMYHPLNPTIKTTMPTKIVTYLSCGLKPITNIEYEPVRDWKEIFKEALCG
jgi:glycosyltransferase involved in cell wall biosynthesis